MKRKTVAERARKIHRGKYKYKNYILLNYGYYPPETLRNWEAAEDAVKDMLSKYTPGGYLGKIIYPVLLPLKERLEAGERTADLYNAIVEATR